MKTRISMLALFAAFTFVTFQQCKKDDDPQPVVKEETSALPSNFKVDIPTSLSSPSSNANKRTNDLILQGNKIYEMLKVFISVGEHAAQVVENLIMAVGTYHLNHAISISFVSEDDNRTKNLVVTENVQLEGKTYEFLMTITDAGFETNPDGGKAIQLFWKRNPVEGVAILKPYNIDYTHNAHMLNTMYRIDYSEAGANGYEQQMVVAIDDIPMANPLVDPFSIETLKMFAGKKGNIVDVFGNSNHPNAKFFNDSVGFNWAFVASGKKTENIGVAEVGLPPSSLNNSDRNTLLKYYAIREVFRRNILDWMPSIDSVDLNAYLYNTTAPGFFSNNGFVQAGTAPNSNYDILVNNIQGLTPYNPDRKSVV